MSRKLQNPSGRIFNLQPDTPDERDYMFKAEKLNVHNVELPVSYDLRITKCIPSILDQGSLGSCGPNQISNSMRYCLKKNKLTDFQPSRLYLYYFTRLFSGSPIDQDTGISIRSGLRTIQSYGACSENNWGYNIPKFTEKPRDDCIKAGKSHVDGFRYIRVQQNLINIKQALYGGFPIIAGIKLFNSFENKTVANTGTVPMPNKLKEACLGGHCISIIGYNDNTKQFICTNSWGESWGNKGYFTLPYDYILQAELTSDLWIITFFK